MCAGIAGSTISPRSSTATACSRGARTEDTNPLEPLADRRRAFGWEVIVCDGHDHAALYDVFVSAREGRPRCIIANTIKGKGVSFIEDRVEWHHKVPSPRAGGTWR